jgi:hypothetical protein
MRLDVAEHPADAARIGCGDLLGDGGSARESTQRGGGKADQPCATKA